MLHLLGVGEGSIIVRRTACRMPAHLVLESSSWRLQVGVPREMARVSLSAFHPLPDSALEALSLLETGTSSCGKTHSLATRWVAS